MSHSASRPHSSDAPSTRHLTPEVTEGMISFVIPTFNEAESLSRLFAEIVQVMSQKLPSFSWEVLFIDDGSTDNSSAVLRAIAEENPTRVRSVRLRTNSGKASALALGFSRARGSLVVTLDADLQDDPAELPVLMTELEKGYDLISGWKEKRHDPLSKTLPSKFFNAVTCALTGLRLNDLNTGYKLYRRPVVKSLRLYGHRHRYIPVLAADLGFRVGEVAVGHRARQFGVSKYGISRFVHGLVDLLSVLTVTRYLQRPAHLFGGVGVVFGVLGTMALGYLFIHWLFSMSPIGTRPLFFFGITMVILSVQFIFFGLLAELVVHTAESRRIEERVAEETTFPTDSGFANGTV